MKKLKILLIITFIFCFLLFNTNVVLASNNRKVAIGGDSIGLKIETGVIILGKYSVDSKTKKISPWKASNIKEGDKIVSIDGVDIYSIEDIANCLRSCTKDQVELLIERSGIKFNTKIDVVVNSSGEKVIGLYLKDKLQGVGTLTFINVETKKYASLGHGIFDHCISMGDVEGELMFSNVKSITKSSPGTPGEKKAALTRTILGDIDKNDITGVYGDISSDYYQNKKLYSIANQNEVVKGSATIMTVLENNKIEEFSVNVTEINHQNTANVKGLKIKITDKKLIDTTGGIVQGMSGSPIIQNDKIIGAVSHVVIENPTYGYGMHADTMYNYTI